MEFIHTRDELLNARDPHHPIRVAFGTRNITSLQELQRFLKDTDTIQLMFTDSTTSPYEIELLDTCKHDLLALPSFLNMLQNEYGLLSSGSPSILKHTRNSFEQFMYRIYDENNPTLYDKQLALSFASYTHSKKVIAGSHEWNEFMVGLNTSSDTKDELTTPTSTTPHLTKTRRSRRHKNKKVRGMRKRAAIVIQNFWKRYSPHNRVQPSTVPSDTFSPKLVADRPVGHIVHCTRIVDLVTMNSRCLIGELSSLLSSEAAPAADNNFTLDDDRRDPYVDSVRAHTYVLAPDDVADIRPPPEPPPEPPPYTKNSHLLKKTNGKVDSVWTAIGEYDVGYEGSMTVVSISILLWLYLCLCILHWSNLWTSVGEGYGDDMFVSTVSDWNDNRRFIVCRVTHHRQYGTTEPSTNTSRRTTKPDVRIPLPQEMSVGHFDTATTPQVPVPSRIVNSSNIIPSSVVLISALLQLYLLDIHVPEDSMTCQCTAYYTLPIDCTLLFAIRPYILILLGEHFDSTSCIYSFVSTNILATKIVLDDDEPAYPVTGVWGDAVIDMLHLLSWLEGIVIVGSTSTLFGVWILMCGTSHLFCCCLAMPFILWSHCIEESLWGDMHCILDHMICCFGPIRMNIDCILTSREFDEFTQPSLALRQPFESQTCLKLHAENLASSLERSGTNIKMGKALRHHLCLRATLGTTRVTCSDLHLRSYHEIETELVPGSILRDSFRSDTILRDSFGNDKCNRRYPEFNSHLQLCCNNSDSTLRWDNGEQTENNKQSTTLTPTGYEGRQYVDENIGSSCLKLSYYDSTLTRQTMDHEHLTLTTLCNNHEHLALIIVVSMSRGVTEGRESYVISRLSQSRIQYGVDILKDTMKCIYTTLALNMVGYLGICLDSAYVEYLFLCTISLDPFTRGYLDLCIFGADGRARKT